MGFMSRMPDSNDPPKNSSNPWGSQVSELDDFAILVNSLGKRCCVCKRVVLNRHIKHIYETPYCPDCYFLDKEGQSFLRTMIEEIESEIETELAEQEGQ